MWMELGIVNKRGKKQKHKIRRWHLGRFLDNEVKTVIVVVGF